MATSRSLGSLLPYRGTEGEEISCPRSQVKVQRCLLIEQAEATHSALRQAAVLEGMISQLFCYS